MDKIIPLERYGRDDNKKSLTDNELRKKALEYITKECPSHDVLCQQEINMADVLEVYYEKRFLSTPEEKAKAYMDDEEDREAKQAL